MGHSRQDSLSNRAGKGADITAIFALFAAGPLLVPFVAPQLSSLAFALPAAMGLLAAVRAWGAATVCPASARAWRIFAVACATGAGSAFIALLGNIAGFGADVGLAAGTPVSLLLLAAGLRFARDASGGRPSMRLVDAGLVGMLVAALGIHFAAIPGFEGGEPLLTAVFLVDVVFLLAVLLGALVRRGVHRHVGLPLVGAGVAVAVGDALVIVTSGSLVLTATLWAAAAGFVALAAESERGDRLSRDEPPLAVGRRWMLARVVIPLAVVLAFPATLGVVTLADGFEAWRVAYFGAFTLAALALAFGRQAQLLIENHRAVSRERAMRQEAMRRNEELEALTGLATTMTQSLEETPILERGLDALRLAARARSGALHFAASSGPALRAATGEWDSDHVWAPPPAEALAGPQGGERSGREILRLPLRARDSYLGLVTLVRPAGTAFRPEERALLGLLADELAIALQNARDYRERLEQAIKDPLTGVYNRRFFFEALEKEVSRSERYGSPVSLVLFDIDDFKQINDSFGHTAGDDVLRRVAGVVENIIRPSDSFARLGGEEFGLLLPETEQLDALIVAERVRTAVSRHRMHPGRRVTLSGGVASCPGDGLTPELLQKRADEALYWCKRNGKNICAVASEATAGEERREGDAMLAHLHGIVTMIDAQQLQTRDHSENVAIYAVALGRAMGFDADRIAKLRRAAFLHDVGKIAVSSEILNKPAGLTEAEFEQMKRHAAVGGEMLAHARFEEEADWVRHHHERIDGAGYPDGLSGEAIPLEARIIFVADSLEAMTSDRPYRSGMSVEDAVAELSRCAGTQFDPRVVATLIDLLERDALTVLALRRAAA